MTDKKLTDQEIIKAFRECGQKMNTNYCDECPYNKGMCNDIQMAKDILDLINRLQAENERLKNKLDVVKQKVIETIPLVEDDIKAIKAEAYKEVEEKLSETIWYRISQKGELVVGANSETDIPLYKAEDVYNLLKELVGEGNGKK